MIIEKIEAIPLVYELEKPICSSAGVCRKKQMLLIKVYTDEGIVGYGDSAPFGGPVQSTKAVIDYEIAPLLVGENPLNIEKLWKKVFYTCVQHGRSGIVISALSGIDIALWDILGKVSGLPVYQLLGGFKRSTPVYASGGFYMENKTNDDLSKEVERYMELGFAGVKIKVGRTPQSKSLGYSNLYSDYCAVSFQDDLQRVKEVREVIGEEALLMVDANCAWQYSDALRAGRYYDELGLYFFEEPLKTDDYESSGKLALNLTTPIAGYETEYRLANFNKLLDYQAVDILQPDLSWSGGITETAKIAHLAEANYKEFTLHMWSSGILLAASVHFTCGLSNGAVLEYDMSPNPFREELMVNPLKYEGGNICVPELPGLGVEIREDIVTKYRID